MPFLYENIAQKFGYLHAPLDLLNNVQYNKLNVVQ